MWANDFTAVPFALGGRSMDGADCWGLYRLAVKARLGLDLPAWADVPAHDLRAVHRAIVAQQTATGWPEVDDPRDGDLVLMRGAFTSTTGRLKGGELHVGCCVEGSHVLHTEMDIGPMLVPLDHWSVKSRILRFYRPC